MPNSIEFIEALGKDAELRHADSKTIERALSAMPIDVALRDAILAADQARLEKLLGAQTNVCCMIHSPDDDEDDEEEPSQDDEKDARTSARTALA